MCRDRPSQEGTFSVGIAELEKSPLKRGADFEKQNWWGVMTLNKELDAILIKKTARTIG